MKHNEEEQFERNPLNTSQVVVGTKRTEEISDVLEKCAIDTFPSNGTTDDHLSNMIISVIESLRSNETSENQGEDNHYLFFNEHNIPIGEDEHEEEGQYVYMEAAV